MIPSVSRPSTSSYHQVFQDEELKSSFCDFLTTIFYQLEKEKVFALMKEILEKNTTEEEVYKDLLQKIQTTLKPLSLLYKIKALFVVRTGMGKQAAQHLAGFEKITDYLEVYTRRYVKAIQRESGLTFQRTTALVDKTFTTLLDRIESGGLLYPYTRLLPLNDPDCKKPSLEVDKTYSQVSEEVGSQDLISCLGGLHHTPIDRLEPFTRSLVSRLKPGGILLLRDHDASDDKLQAIASVVHSFVNAVDQVPWEEEKAEIRNFQGQEYWTSLLERQGLQRIDRKALILPKDPTKNAMTAFVKLPCTGQEVEEAALHRKKYLRSKIGSYATWIEWGNVRYSKQYAEFIQTHHSYEFNFLGAIRQHWLHFYHYTKESLAKGEEDRKDLFFSDSAAMNLFILLGTTVLLSASALASLPARLTTFFRGHRVEHLSALERFEADFQKDYSAFIDYDPFFKYPYFKKIREMWDLVLHSDESFFTKAADTLGALSFTVTLGLQGLFSAGIDSIYYAEEGTSDQETIDLLLEDPEDEMETVIAKWNHFKEGFYAEDKTHGTHRPFLHSEMAVIYSAENTKVVSVPFYKPFTTITGFFADTKINLLKAGGQEKITLDLLIDNQEEAKKEEGLLYTLPRLHENKIYATYEVAVSKLATFYNRQQKSIDYIHAPR